MKNLMLNIESQQEILPNLLKINLLCFDMPNSHYLLSLRLLGEMISTAPAGFDLAPSLCSYESECFLKHRLQSFLSFSMIKDTMNLFNCTHLIFLLHVS